jgi:hypothetical protein
MRARVEGRAQIGAGEGCQLPAPAARGASGSMTPCSGAGADDFLGADRLVAGAALGEQEGDKFLKRFGVGRAAKEYALTPHGHKALILELFEMMRER